MLLRGFWRREKHQPSCSRPLRHSPQAFSVGQSELESFELARRGQCRCDAAFIGSTQQSNAGASLPSPPHIPSTLAAGSLLSPPLFYSPMAKRPSARYAMHMYYFAYGANLNKRAMARRCPAAKAIGVATLHDYRLCFKRFADISPMPGSCVMGALWEITPRCVRALDEFEGPEYVQITVSVKIESQTMTAMAYAMRGQAVLTPPSMEYVRELSMGYRDWQLDEALLRRARYDTLKVGVTPAPQKANAPSTALVKRRSALWDPATNATGSLDALTTRPVRPGVKRPSSE